MPPGGGFARGACTVKSQCVLVSGREVDGVNDTSYPFDQMPGLPAVISRTEPGTWSGAIRTDARLDVALSSRRTIRAPVPPLAKNWETAYAASVDWPSRSPKSSMKAGKESTDTASAVLPFAKTPTNAATLVVAGTTECAAISLTYIPGWVDRRPHRLPSVVAARIAGRGPADADLPRG
jgi:hypothetical protein